MSADHKKPVMAFIVLAVLAATVIGMQLQADAGSGRFLAVGPLSGAAQGLLADVPEGADASRAPGEGVEAGEDDGSRVAVDAPHGADALRIGITGVLVRAGAVARPAGGALELATGQWSGVPWPVDGDGDVVAARPSSGQLSAGVASSVGKPAASRASAKGKGHAKARGHAKRKAGLKATSAQARGKARGHGVGPRAPMARKGPWKRGHAVGLRARHRASGHAAPRHGSRAHHRRGSGSRGHW